MYAFAYFKTLLKRLSLLLKIDLLYVVKNNVWLAGSQILSGLLSFVLAVALANVLTEEGFGNYRYILAMSAIVASFTLTGIKLALIRDIAKGRKGLLRASFLSALKWSAGIFIISLSLSGYYVWKENSAIATSFLIMALSLPIISSTHIYAAYLEGKKEYKRISLYNVLSVLIYTLSVLGTIYFTQQLPFIIFAYFVSQAVSSSFFFFRTVRSNEIGEKGDIGHTLNFGKHLSFLNILSSLAGQLDKLLIFHYLGAAQLGVYIISQIPIMHLQAILKQTTQLAYPKYSAKSLEEIKRTIYQKMRVFTVFIVCTISFYIVVSPFIFEIFFPKYQEAVIYSQIAALSLLFAQKKLISYTILAHGSKRSIYAMSIPSSLFKIALLLLLLPFFGIWGAIATELIAQLIGFIMSVRMLKRI